jgi:hypothetical protein
MYFTIDGGEISWERSKQSMATSSMMQAKVIACRRQQVRLFALRILSGPKSCRLHQVITIQND